jgi:hypothetical protein
VAKPRGDLGSLVVPKAAAAQAIPHAAASAPPGPPPPLPPPPQPLQGEPAQPAQGGGPKALTVKLDGAAYRRLRRYCQEQEEATGRRVTHQEVMVEALAAFLSGRPPQP